MIKTGLHFVCIVTLSLYLPSALFFSDIIKIYLKILVLLIKSVRKFLENGISRTIYHASWGQKHTRLASCSVKGCYASIGCSARLSPSLMLLDLLQQLLPPRSKQHQT